MKTSGQSHWASVWVRAYYLLGILYYAYHWFIIAGGVGLLGSAAAFFILGADGWLIGVGLISLVATVVGVTVLVSNWKRRYRSTNSGLKIFSSETTYRLLPGARYLYRREIDAVVSMHGADHFTHIFAWTGGDDISVSAENGHRAELSDDPLSAKKRLRIYFDRPRARGDRLRIAYQIDMHDEKGTARNCLRTTLNEKIRRMKTRIIFDSGDCPDMSKHSIFMSDSAEIPVSEDEVPVNKGDNSTAWEIRKPRLGYNYCISW